MRSNARLSIYRSTFFIVVLLLFSSIFNLHVFSGVTPNSSSRIIDVSSASYRIEYYFRIESLNGKMRLQIPLPGNITFQSSRIIERTGEVALASIVGKNGNTVLYIESSDNLFEGRIVFNITVYTPYNISGELYKYNLRSLINSKFGLSSEDYEKYVKPTYWWNYSDPEVSNYTEDLKREILGDENITLGEAVSKIRDFVVSTITYEVQEKRVHVKKVLELHKGDCSDYSDLFVTITRCIGIPSRRALGLILTDWSDAERSYKPLGHAWPEIYVPEIGWVPVETTLTSNESALGPGEFSSAYLTLFIEEELPSVNKWDPLNGDLLVKPDETWYPGYGLPLKLDSALNVESQIKISHFSSGMRIGSENFDEYIFLSAIFLLAFVALSTMLVMWKRMKSYEKVLIEVSSI